MFIAALFTKSGNHPGVHRQITEHREAQLCNGMSLSHTEESSFGTTPVNPEDMLREGNWTQRATQSIIPFICPCILIHVECQVKPSIVYHVRLLNFMVEITFLSSDVIIWLIA